MPVYCILNILIPFKACPAFLKHEQSIKMLQVSCYRLKPGDSSTTIVMRVAIFVYYNCISQICCGMETEYLDPE
jgi:hypothetical protein